MTARIKVWRDAHPAGPNRRVTGRHPWSASVPSINVDGIGKNRYSSSQARIKQRQAHNSEQREALVSGAAAKAPLPGGLFCRHWLCAPLPSAWAT